MTLGLVGMCLFMWFFLVAEPSLWSTQSHPAQTAQQQANLCADSS